MDKSKQHSYSFSSTGKSGNIFVVRYFFLFLLLPGLIIACDKINVFFRPYAATVNGSKIYLDDYQARLDKKMQMLPKDFQDRPDYMKRFDDEVLDSMISEKIMHLRAQELNISVSESELENKINEF